MVIQDSPEWILLLHSSMENIMSFIENIPEHKRHSGGSFKKHIILTTEDIAEILNLSVSYTRRLISQGKLDMTGPMTERFHNLMNHKAEM